MKRRVCVADVALARLSPTLPRTPPWENFLPLSSAQVPARRALLRARLALAHLLDPVPRQPERWEPQATQYLALAEAALDRMETTAA